MKTNEDQMKEQPSGRVTISHEMYAELCRQVGEAQAYSKSIKIIEMLVANMTKADSITGFDQGALLRQMQQGLAR